MEIGKYREIFIKVKLKSRVKIRKYINFSNYLLTEVEGQVGKVSFSNDLSYRIVKGNNRRNSLIRSFEINFLRNNISPE